MESNYEFKKMLSEITHVIISIKKTTISQHQNYIR